MQQVRKSREKGSIRAAFVDEMSDAGSELQTHLEGAKLTTPGKMISKLNHFQAVALSLVARVARSVNTLAATTKSRLRKSAQDDKWSFCLTAGTLCPVNQERP